MLPCLFGSVALLNPSTTYFGWSCQARTFLSDLAAALYKMFVPCTKQYDGFAGDEQNPSHKSRRIFGLGLFGASTHFALKERI